MNELSKLLKNIKTLNQIRIENKVENKLLKLNTQSIISTTRVLITLFWIYNMINSNSPFILPIYQFINPK